MFSGHGLEFGDADVGPWQELVDLVVRVNAPCMGSCRPDCHDGCRDTLFLYRYRCARAENCALEFVCRLNQNWLGGVGAA